MSPDRLPSALDAAARRERFGSARIPALLVHPDWARGEPVPTVIWMHGRTARKETDPGRYLRLMRAGFGVCGLDLPGHGERFEASRQHARRTLDLILQMMDELDEVVTALAAWPLFDRAALGIGGMSAGGMAALARLCRPHPFRAASVEGTSGSWEHERRREMFRGRSWAEVAENDPIDNLAGWREIPLQAIHSRRDAWVSFDGQAVFLEALRERYADPDLIELVAYERTGAPFEHAGFGRMASDAKNRQRDFFVRWLAADPIAVPRGDTAGDATAGAAS